MTLLPKLTFICFLILAASAEILSYQGDQMDSGHKLNGSQFLDGVNYTVSVEFDHVKSDSQNVIQILYQMHRLIIENCGNRTQCSTNFIYKQVRGTSPDVSVTILKRRNSFSSFYKLTISNQRDRRIIRKSGYAWFYDHIVKVNFCEPTKDYVINYKAESAVLTEKVFLLKVRRDFRVSATQLPFLETAENQKNYLVPDSFVGTYLLMVQFKLVEFTRENAGLSQKWSMTYPTDQVFNQQITGRERFICGISAGDTEIVTESGDYTIHDQLGFDKFPVQAEAVYKVRVQFDETNPQSRNFVWVADPRTYRPIHSAECRNELSCELTFTAKSTRSLNLKVGRGRSDDSFPSYFKVTVTKEQTNEVVFSNSGYANARDETFKMTFYHESEKQLAFLEMPHIQQFSVYILEVKSDGSINPIKVDVYPSEAKSRFDSTEVYEIRIPDGLAGVHYIRLVYNISINYPAKWALSYPTNDNSHAFIRPCKVEYQEIQGLCSECFENAFLENRRCFANV